MSRYPVALLDAVDALSDPKSRQACMTELEAGAAATRVWRTKKPEGLQVADWIALILQERERLEKARAASRIEVQRRSLRLRVIQGGKS